MDQDMDRQSNSGVDVDELMKKVRASVAGKIEQGFYTEEEIRAVNGMELSISEKKDFGADLEEAVSWLHANWDPNGPRPIDSHRPLAGKVLVPAKKLLRRLLKPFSSLILIKQTDFNMHLTQLLATTLPSLRDDAQGLEQRFEDLVLKHYELIKRHQELYRRFEALSVEVQRGRAAAPGTRRPPEAKTYEPPEASALPEDTVDTAAYLSFEDRHRGPTHEIKATQRDYLEYFSGCSTVLDAGCGRGEFLEVLSEAGINSYGVDSNREMVDLCQKKGLKVIHADINEHLEGLEDNYLGGVFSAQLAEHMTTAQLQRFIRLAWEKSAPGSMLVVETINPACLATFAGPVYLDLTHTKPIHPEAMRFLMESAGFSGVEIRYRSPFPEEMKLKQVDLFHRLQRFEDALLNVVNDNFNQLNDLIYGCQDYAAIARK